MLCPKCGNANDIAAKFCANCGNTLSQPTQDEFIPLTGIKSQTQKTELYKAIIGPKNQSYYLEKFSEFDSSGEISASWHWPAFFVTAYWAIYRKMWQTIFLYSFLPLLFMLFVSIFFIDKNPTGSNIFYGIFGLLYLVYIFILPPMYANAAYYKWCKKKISAIEASSNDFQTQLKMASKKGGTSIVVFVSLAAIPVIGILAAVALPAYQDYTTKARTAEVATFGLKVTESLTTYYSKHQSVTSNLVEAGFSEALPPSVKSVGVDNEYGVVTLTLTEGKTLLFVPSLDENLKMSWQCMSKEIEDKHLPKLCRQAN